MFGFILNQPLHVSLRQMRLVQVLLILSSQALLWYIVQKLEHLNPEQSAMALGTIAVTLIAQIWKGVDSLHRTNESDIDDHSTVEGYQPSSKLTSSPRDE